MLTRLASPCPAFSSRSRSVGGGGVLGQMSINSMALPPIIKYGAAWMQEQVVRPVVTGKKNCSLMISEPYAGSDVANIRTTAVKQVGATCSAPWRAARANLLFPCSTTTPTGDFDGDVRSLLGRLLRGQRVQKVRELRREDGVLGAVVRALCCRSQGLTSSLCFCAGGSLEASSPTTG